MKRQLTATTLKQLKVKLYQDQDGLCALCGLSLDPDMSKNHLDHDHALEGSNAGRVRGLLHACCNRADGRVMNKLMMSGVLSQLDLNSIQWLEKYVEYLKKDHTDGYFHPQYITDTIKQFKKLSLDEMRKELTRKGYSYPDRAKKADLVKIFTTEFRKEQKSL